MDDAEPFWCRVCHQVGVLHAGWTCEYCADLCSRCDDPLIDPTERDGDLCLYCAFGEK